MPELDDGVFVPLDPNYLRVSLVAMGIFATIVVAVCGAIAIRVEMAWIPLLVLAIVLALVAVAATLRRIEIRNIGYQVRTHDISFRRGVVKRTVSTLPFVRVQHARLDRGPVERRFGLATLHVNSAGPDLVIPGLPVADAERIKALVTDRAGALTEEP